MAANHGASVRQSDPPSFHERSATTDDRFTLSPHRTDSGLPTGVPRDIPAVKGIEPRWFLTLAEECHFGRPVGQLDLTTTRASQQNHWFDVHINGDFSIARAGECNSPLSDHYCARNSAPPTTGSWQRNGIAVESPPPGLFSQGLN